MKQRDKDIMKDLEKFRCMGRNDIAEIHFANVKNPIKHCNEVLKRLRRDGYISCNKNYSPYVYFPVDSIKKDSQKIPHFLAILDFYKQLKQIEPPKIFEVEPKFGTEYMEADVFTIWKQTPFFVEIQRHVYSQKVMEKKIKLYENYYMSDEWKKLHWQPKDKKIFPRLWIITDHQYNISAPFKVLQTKTAKELLRKIS
jgi:hypothetical protein